MVAGNLLWNILCEAINQSWNVRNILTQIQKKYYNNNQEPVSMIVMLYKSEFVPWALSLEKQIWCIYRNEARTGGAICLSFHSKPQQTCLLSLFCLWTLLPERSAGHQELARALCSWSAWQHVQGIDIVDGVVPLNSHHNSSGVWRVISWISPSIWKLFYSHIIPRESVIQGITL